MSDTAIRVENLSKQYRLGQYIGYKTLRDSLMDAIGLPPVEVPELNSRNAMGYRGVLSSD